jgi:hypothetical protein
MAQVSRQYALIAGGFLESQEPPIYRPDRRGHAEGSATRLFGAAQSRAPCVDCAFLNLSRGMWDIAATGLPGKIEPLLSRSVIEDGV